jgi:hypothetical protein
MARAGGDDQLQPGQAAKHGARQRCSLPDPDHRVEFDQPRDQPVGIFHMVGKRHELGPRGKPAPAIEGERGFTEIVE